MHTKITVVSTTVETEVDAERNRRPSWILGATIKAYLYNIITISEYHTHTQGKGTLYLSQPEIPTLLARFDLSFSNIFWPSVLDAKLMMIAKVGTRV